MTTQIFYGVSGTLGAGNSLSALHIGSPSLTTSAWIGSNIFMINGPNSGLTRTITYNTVTGVSCVAFPSSGAAGNQYLISPSNVSRTFSATVNGSSTFTYGETRNRHSPNTIKYNNGDALEASFFKVGSDAIISSVITYLSGSISSFEITPSSLITSAAIVGGKLNVSSPINTKYHVVVNNNYKNTLIVHSSPLKPSIPAGAITYDGTQLSCPTGSSIYFPPGQNWRIGVGFPVYSSGTIYIDQGAQVNGTFDFRLQNGMSIVGAGVHTGEGLGGGAPVVATLPFSAGILYAMYLGWDTNNSILYQLMYNNTVSGLIVVDPPQYFNAQGVHTAKDLALINPWNGGAGGYAPGVDFYTGRGSIVDFICVNADDIIQSEGNYGAITVSNAVFLHTANAAFRDSYWPDTTVADLRAFRALFPSDPGINYSHNYSSVYIRSIASANTGNYATTNGSIFGSWLDGSASQSYLDIENRNYKNIKVEGDLNCRLVDFRNITYPYSGGPDPGVKYGQLKNYVFDNITVDGRQITKSVISGIDSINTPHDVTFINVNIGNTLVTNGNKYSYFDINNTPYNIIFYERDTLLSSLENGLNHSWQGIPYSFQLSDTAAADTFLDNHGKEFISALMGAGLPYHSFWSLDIMNEAGNTDQTVKNHLIASTLVYCSSLVSSLPRRPLFTVGEPNLNAYTANIGTTNPGGKSDQYLSSYEVFSSLLDFLSFHAYVVNNSDRSDVCAQTVSGARWLGKPAMPTEGNFPVYYNYTSDNASGMYAKGFGIFEYDAMAEFPLSIKPYLQSNGLFYTDGTCRHAADAIAFRNLTLLWGWIKEKQLLPENETALTKTVTTNQGADGGFYSGYGSQYASFLPDLYVSTNQTAWTFTRDVFFATCQFSAASKTFSPWIGDPLAVDHIGLDPFIGEITSRDAINFVKNWPPVGLTLSSPLFPVNEQAYLFDNITNSVYLSLVNSHDLLYFGDLSGTIYDNHRVTTPHRLAVSAASLPFVGYNGSAVTPWYNPCFDTYPKCVSYTGPSFPLGACYYVVPGNPLSGLDWAAYDRAYATYAAALKNCILDIEAAGVSF